MSYVIQRSHQIKIAAYLQRQVNLYLNFSKECVKGEFALNPILDSGLLKIIA